MTPRQIQRARARIKEFEESIERLTTRLNLLRRDYDYQDTNEQRRRDFVINDDEAKLQEIYLEIEYQKALLNDHYAL